MLLAALCVRAHQLFLWTRASEDHMRRSNLNSNRDRENHYHMVG